MKKHILTSFLFCLCAFPLLAQAPWQAQYQTMELLRTQSEHRKGHQEWAEKGIRTYSNYALEIRNGQPTGDSFLVSRSVYDRQGNYISSETFRKNGKSKIRSLYTNDDSNRVTGIIREKNGKRNSATTYTYNAAGLVLESRYFGKTDDKRYSSTVNVYDRNNNLLETKTFWKDKSEPDYRAVYTYYPNGQRESITIYDRKGRIKNVWTYDCKEESQVQSQKHEDTSGICIRYEQDKDGNPIKVVEQVMPGQKVEKSVNRFDHKGNRIEAATYDRKGRQLSGYIYTYNDDGYMTSQKYFHKSKLRLHGVLQYDTDNIRNITTYFDEDGKVTSVYRIVAERY